MLTLYISPCSRASELVVERMVAECESFLDGQCYVIMGSSVWSKEKIRNKLKDCDVLIIAIDGIIKTSGSAAIFGKNILWEERIRFEIVSAMNLGLLVIPLLINSSVLPEKRNIPGSLKCLLDFKPYRLREALWNEDLSSILEDIQGELDLKKDVESKMSKLNQPKILGLTDSEDKRLRPHGLGLEFSGYLELRRVIESERLNLEEARYQGDLRAERKALSLMSIAFTELGQTKKAIELFEEQLNIVRKLKDSEEEIRLLASLGDAFAISGEIERAKRYYQEQLLRADSGGHSHLVASALNGLGFVAVKQKKISEAIKCYSEALKIFQKLNNHEKELELLVGIGLNYQKLGNLREMINFLEQALDRAKYLENRKEEARILMDLVEAYFSDGNFKVLRIYLARAQAVLKFRDEEWTVPLKSLLIFFQDALKKINQE